MKRTLLLAACALLAACGAERSEPIPVRLEFRAAETEPADGLTEYRLWNGEVLYVADSVLLDENDVARALVAVRDGTPEVELFFTVEGRERWARATELRLGKRIGMLVDGELISAPLVRRPITVGRALLQGSFSDEEAQRIARGLGRQRSSK